VIDSCGVEQLFNCQHICILQQQELATEGSVSTFSMKCNYATTRNQQQDQRIWLYPHCLSKKLGAWSPPLLIDAERAAGNPSCSKCHRLLSNATQLQSTCSDWITWRDTTSFESTHFNKRSILQSLHILLLRTNNYITTITDPTDHTHVIQNLRHNLTFKLHNNASGGRFLIARYNETCLIWTSSFPNGREEEGKMFSECKYYSLHLQLHSS